MRFDRKHNQSLILSYKVACLVHSQATFSGAV